MDINKYQLKIARHVFARALERGIHPDLIEKTIETGKMETYGKHGVKFVSKGERTIICVGQIVGTELRIFTIEDQ